jgi:hypothetical protein
LWKIDSKGSHLILQFPGYLYLPGELFVEAGVLLYSIGWSWAPSLPCAGIYTPSSLLPSMFFLLWGAVVCFLVGLEFELSAFTLVKQGR